jgi:hypothetical protein
MKHEKELQNKRLTRSDKMHDSGKEPCTSSKKTSISLDKGSEKKVTIKDLSKKGSLLLFVL